MHLKKGAFFVYHGCSTIIKNYRSDFMSNPKSNIPNFTQGTFNIGASKEIEESTIEFQKAINEVEEFIKKEGLVKRKYVDEAGAERVGVFRSDNSELSISQLWDFMDTDLPSLTPEEQRELQEFWDRFNIKFKDYDPDKEIESKFGKFF